MNDNNIPDLIDRNEAMQCIEDGIAQVQSSSHFTEEEKNGVADILHSFIAILSSLPSHTLNGSKNQPQKGSG